LERTLKLNLSISQTQFNMKNLKVKSISSKNLKDIPAINEKHDCGQCLWYQKEKQSLEAKKQWFVKMEKKYGSCGKILYLKDKAIGFAQFGPKSIFPRLKSKNANVWYITCLAIKEEYRGKGFGKVLLKSVLSDLKKRKVKKVQICGLISGDIGNFSAGFWQAYEKLGFKEIAKTKKYKVGEKLL